MHPKPPFSPRACSKRSLASANRPGNAGTAGGLTGPVKPNSLTKRSGRRSRRKFSRHSSCHFRSAATCSANARQSGSVTARSGCVSSDRRNRSLRLKTSVMPFYVHASFAPRSTVRNFIKPSNSPLSVRLALVGGIYFAVAVAALLPNAKPPGGGVDLWLHALVFGGLTILTVGAFGRVLTAAAIVFAFSAY